MNHSTFLRFFVVLIAFVGIGLVSWAPNASAFREPWNPHAPKDAKIYPGTACIRISGPAKLLYDIDGSIRNNDPRRTIKVNCPIIRDMTTDDRGLREFKYNAYMPGNIITSCYLRAIQPTRRGVGSKTVQEDKKKFGKSLSLSSNFPKGVMYMFSCDLPPGSRLRAYYAYETEH